MILEHYGYPSLERWPNTYFVEQLCHLQIAIEESDNNIFKDIKVTSKFAETAQGQLLAWMREHGQYKTYTEIGDHMGKNHKQAKKYIQALEWKGVEFLRRANKNKVEVKAL